MPNWLQLIEHTAEYVPGPWEVIPPTFDTGTDAVVYARGTNTRVAVVPPTAGGRYPELRNGRLSNNWDDPAQDATARLLAESETMLLMLAEWQSLSEDRHNPITSVKDAIAALQARTAELLARHVRVGYEPPTAAVAAARRDPPPPPPAPTLFDDVG